MFARSSVLALTGDKSGETKEMIARESPTCDGMGKHPEN
jgi:hypothetical protein